MPAPKGNDYWRKAANPGQPRKYKDPKELWALFTEYCDWCDNNPEYKFEMLKKPFEDLDPVTGEIVYTFMVPVPVKRSYLISGFCSWIGVNTVYLNQMEDRLDLTDPGDKEYAKVLRAIRDVIYTYHVTGGLNGTLDSRLAARIQGIADKRETENKVTITDEIDYDLLDDETLEKIAKARKTK